MKFHIKGPPVKDFFSVYHFLKAYLGIESGVTFNGIVSLSWRANIMRGVLLICNIWTTLNS